MTEKELKQLFYEHQHDLLWIANSPVGKKLLDYELNLPIIQIFPHFYRLDPDKYSMNDKKLRKHYIDRFFTYDRIAELFLPILTNLDLYRSTYGKIEDPYRALLHYSGFEKGKYPLFLHAISTFTANGGGHGRIFAQNATYLTARNATTGTVDTGIARPAQDLLAGPNYSVQRSFAPFNTATIPGGSTIVSGANNFIRAVGAAIEVNTDSDSVSVVASTQASNTALEANDFDNVGTTKFATDLLITSWIDTGNNDFQLNTDGIANISLTSYSRFAWRTAQDISATAPTGANNVSMVNDTNLLSVEHIPGGSGLFSKIW